MLFVLRMLMMGVHFILAGLLGLRLWWRLRRPATQAPARGA